MYLCYSYIRALGVKHGNKECEEESESLLLLLFSYIYENFNFTNMAQMNIEYGVKSGPMVSRRMI